MKKFILLSAFVLITCTSFAQNKGIRYQGEVQVGYALGVGDEEFKIDRLSIHMINGIRFNPYLSAGVGLGLDSYSKSGVSFLSMPLFLNMKGYLPVSQKVDLFASIDLGYSVALKSEEQSGRIDNIDVDVKLGMKGFMFTPAIGASFKVADHKAINLSLGYDIKTVTAEASAQGHSASESRKCNAIGLKLGYSF